MVSAGKRPSVFLHIAFLVVLSSFGIADGFVSQSQGIHGVHGQNLPQISKADRGNYQRRNPTHLPQVSPRDYWEGDDRRWSTRFQRRLRRQFATGPRVRTTLVFINLAMFCYQVTTSVLMIRRKWPSYWPNQALSMIWDSTWETPLNCPVTRDFAHSIWRSRFQPHRYLTSGFIHGGLLHFLVNMDSLRKAPIWLESGLGGALYLSTYLVTIVTGNVGHTLMNVGNMERVACLGSSGGICGLYGLLYASLTKMGNARAAWQVATSMIILFVYGFFSPQVSNAAHIGGFCGGVVMGILFGPSYRKSYAARRKNSLDVDPYSRDYRLAMGFGSAPSERGLLPLSVLWQAAIFGILSIPSLRSAPLLILKGMVQPGSL